MLGRLHHARTNLAGSLPAHGSLTTLRLASSAASIYTPKTSTAKKLADWGVWGTAATLKKKKGAKVKARDTRRVNIVSEELCDDIIKYIGPSLERHKGCDLLDLNPGCGIWSRKLNEALQPRSHIMMDPDAELYKPFLEPILSQPSSELIPSSGIVWENLLSVLANKLPQQKPITDRNAPPKRNDTLVVTANLAMWPKKALGGFSSVSTMVLYQFLTSIPTRTLWNQYGLVRFFVWVGEEDRTRILPRALNRRKRTAFEAELSLEWLHEVASWGMSEPDRLNLRDNWLNMESGLATMKRMEDAGLVMPKGRETEDFLGLKKQMHLTGIKLAGERLPSIERPYLAELEDLQQDPETEDAATSKRLKSLVARQRFESQHIEKYLELLKIRDAALKAYADGGNKPTPEFLELDAAFHKGIEMSKKNQKNEFKTVKDNLHAFRQDPPVLMWDRRAYEPLAAKAGEFYPQVPTCLLDFQPKSMNPLFLQHGPASTRSGDYGQVMLKSVYHHLLMSVSESMAMLWPGFGDMTGSCPSLTDPTRGGSPMSGHGELPLRAMNEEIWAEVVQAWMDWPFKPTYQELLGRMMEDLSEVEDDGGAMGNQGW